MNTNNNTTRNWRTTVFGALMLAISGFTIYNDPNKAMDPNVMGTIAGGLGLLLAKDANKTGIVSSTTPDNNTNTKEDTK